MKCICVTDGSGKYGCERCWRTFPITPQEVEAVGGLSKVRRECRGLGLGDRIAWALSRVGLDTAKVERLFQRWFSKPCGCSARQEKLNRMGWYIVKPCVLLRRRWKGWVRSAIVAISGPET